MPFPAIHQLEGFLAMEDGSASAAISGMQFPRM
jgi:hypothetical protein